MCWFCLYLIPPKCWCSPPRGFILSQIMCLFVCHILQFLPFYDATLSICKTETWSTAFLLLPKTFKLTQFMSLEVVCEMLCVCSCYNWGVRSFFYYRPLFLWWYSFICKLGTVKDNTNFSSSKFQIEPECVAGAGIENCGVIFSCYAWGLSFRFAWLFCNALVLPL